MRRTFFPLPVRPIAGRARVVALAVLVAAGGTVSQGMARAQEQPSPPDRVFVEGEELVYNVRYGFIDLGQVRIKIIGTVSGNSSLAYEGRAYIDSYPKVPFVDLHAVYESRIDSGNFARRFVGRQKNNGQWDLSRYNFDYPDKRLLIEVGTHDSVITRRDTLVIETPYHGPEGQCPHDYQGTESQHVH
jgi:hypothetical protein